MHVRDQQPGKKLKLSGLLVAFLFTSVFGFAFLFAGTPAQAQFVDTPNLTVNTLTSVNTTGSKVNEIKQTTWDTVKIALANTAAMALLNAGNYFLQKIAYDTANYIATGGKGQKPLFTTKGIKDELSSVSKDAAGEALGTITETSGLGALGVNLCAPTNPRIALNIKLGFVANVNPPRPKCSWSQISSNWDQFTSQTSDEVLRQAGAQFSEDRESPLGAALQFNRESLDLISDKKNAAIISYQTNQGFKDVTSKISGDVKTPATVVQDRLKATHKLADDQQAKDVMITGDAFKAGAYGVLGAAVKTFTNTLAQKLMQRVFDKGIISISNVLPCVNLLGNGGLKGLGTSCAGGSNSPLTNPNAVANGGIAAANLANADLLAPKIFSTTNYDALLDFTSCPDGSAKGPTNCVMDSQFYAAVGRAADNVPVTLQQAVDQGLVNGGWRLLPLSHPKNSDRNCYQESFCYSNLVKMRTARIIPIGWELAANSPYNDLNNPVTLKEAMDRFNDCPFLTDSNGKVTVDTSKLPDPLHPWCRLIDPNWVLKYPKSICRQKGPGPQLQDQNSNARASLCVDAASCINEDSDGNCSAGYGYCVRERSAWRIDADACQAQNASCQAVASADGGNFAFLLNTVKAGVCNADNAGCLGRSVVANAIPNGGFEDTLLNGAVPRDWGTSGPSGSEVDGSVAYRGVSAGFLIAPAGALTTTAAVTPEKPYTLSFSAKADQVVGATARANVKISFLNLNKSPISGPIVQDCVTTAANSSVTASVALTNLGYQTTTCKITTPKSAYFAAVSATASGTGGVRVYFDEVGLFGGTYSASPLDQTFLNGKAEDCSQTKEGCRTLVRATGAALNLVRNPDFEERTVDDKRPTFWNSVADADYSGNGQKSYEGSAAVLLPNTGINQVIEGALPNATYTFSVYTKAEGAAGGTVNILRANSQGVPSGSSICTESAGGPLVLKNGATYNRATCTFTVPDGSPTLYLVLAKTSGAGALIADGIQFELGTTASNFHNGYASEAQQIHLKVAPEGMTCTGASTDPSACANFAKSCRREDVGCSLYTANDGSTPLPAIATAADVCPSVCSGYEAYREEPSNFGDAAFPVPFIPSTATQCAAKEAGCQEFTNLERVASGGEARQYFTGIRLCQKPDDQTVTYYTWEGNDTKGFQLRNWVLRQSNTVSAAGTGDPTGGTAPCTNLGYDGQNNPICKDTAATVFACNKDQLKFNPDCREFYDADGNIHYRLYSHTIVANDQCTEYRMTTATQNDCTNHGGLWIRNECHYFGYAPENVACQATSNNCRAYTGNAARNIRIASTDGFEDGTRGDWSTVGADNSNESVTVGGKSLKVTTGQISKPLYKNGLYSVNKGKSYLVAFWAKGTGDLTPTLVAAAGQTKPFASIALTTDWRPYVVGPVILDVAPDTTAALQLTFSPAASTARPSYIDNVELREIADSIYVVKSSWKTPAVCDQDPNGNAAPQYMLGCKSYKTQTGTQSYEKSFSRLCQQQAVGCSALYDTHNTISPFPETWNAVCTLSVASIKTGTLDAKTGACVPGANGTSCTCNSAENVTCEVSRGNKSCRFNLNASVADSELGESGKPLGDVVRIKADSLSYIIEDAQYKCDAADIGCSAIAKPIQDADQKIVTAWETVYVKNDPSKYEQTLCTQPENSCQVWSRVEDGSPLYFKDPGNRTCEFKSDATVGGSKASGWFKPGTEEPCYPDYLQAGSNYGIWKNSDTKYDAWVGVCDANQSRCKEFLDPTDASPDFPQGRPYYFIKNDKLDIKSCGAQVSRTKAPSGATVASACALFKQSDDVTNTYDAPRTYDLSEKQFGALVSPIDESTADHAKGTKTVKAGGTCGDGTIVGQPDEECDQGANNGGGLGCSASCLFENNANIIIRATRDRQCAAWLDCRSSESVFNPSTGAFQSVCSSFGLCAEYRKVGDSTRCVKYIDSSYKNNVLTTGIYETRDIGWGSLEFSGDSVPFRYPLDQLKTIVITDNTVKPPRKDPRLVYASGTCPNQNDFTACGAKNNLGNRGTCIQGQCVWPINGGLAVGSLADLQQTTAKNAYAATSCRVYPKEDSPFPGTVADPSGWDNSVSEINDGNPRLIGPKSAFNGANVCQRRVVKVGNDSVTYDSCECGYIQASYGTASTKFFPLNGPDVPNGYCESGTYKDLECDPNAAGLRTGKNLSCCSKLSPPDSDTGAQDCQDDGGCQQISKTEYLVGYQGQCIERDFATPINGRSDEFACANWRPTSIVGGTFDIYNLNRTAGYFAPVDRRFYCEAPTTPDQKIGVDAQGNPYGYQIRLGIVNVPATVPPDIAAVAPSLTNDIGSAARYSQRFIPAKQFKCSNSNTPCDGSSANECGTGGICNRIWTLSSSTDPTKLGTDPVSGADTDSAGSVNDQGPKFQPANNFFGPGKVNRFWDGFSSGKDQCAAGDVSRFCIFPGISTICTQDANAAANGTAASSCTSPDVYALHDPVSYGIVGCYEVADGQAPGNLNPPQGSDSDPPTIEWPYIGPPIYQDQLQNIDLELSYNLYGGGNGTYQSSAPYAEVKSASPYENNQQPVRYNSGGNHGPVIGQFGLGPTDYASDNNETNPHQYVYSGCNDEGTRSLPAGLTGIMHCALDATNGFKKDCADQNQGSIVWQANFDSQGALHSLKLMTTDRSYSGTFGVRALDFNFKSSCAVVGRVDQQGSLGLTVADTEFVNPYRQFGSPVPIVSSTNFNQACRPWGSIGSQSQNPPVDPTDVTTPTRWTSVSLLPLAKKPDGTLDKSKEAQVDQCTVNSYRMASTYVVPPDTVPNRIGPFGQYINTLFKKIASSWRFTPPSASTVFGGKITVQPFAPVTGADVTKFQYDLSSSLPASYYRPQVASVDTANCGSDGICPVKNINTVAINGHDSGVLTGQDGIFPANMQFYAWASHNSMPVRERTVSWGDLLPSEPGAEGWYKNHKPYCSPDESDKNAAKECDLLRGLTCRADTDCPNSICNGTAGAHFGNTPGACDTTPYKFDHIFTCTASDLKTLNDTNGKCRIDDLTDRALNAPCVRDDAVTGDVPTCVYRPRVQIVDNWGTCNCSGSGCQNVSFNTSANQCDMDKVVPVNDARNPPPVPWTSFNGEIRVFPNAQDVQAFGATALKTATPWSTN